MYCVNNGVALKNRREVEKNIDGEIKKQLQGLPKNALFSLLFSYAKKYPEVKRDLLVCLSIDEKQAGKLFLKQIHQEFGGVVWEEGYSTARVARNLKKIVKQAESASVSVRIQVYWAIARRIFHELNEYGMDDDSFKDLRMEVMDSLIALRKKDPELAGMRESIRKAIL